MNRLNWWGPVARYLVDPAINAGNLRFARQISRAYVKSRPRDPEGWILLQRCFLAAGDEARAQEVLEEGTRKNPDSLPLVTALAQTLTFQNKLDESEALLRHAQAEHGEKAAIHIELADIELRRSNWNQTTRMIERAYELIDRSNIGTSSYAKTHVVDELTHLGSIMLHVPDGTEKANTFFEEAVSIGSRDPRPHMALGLLKGENTSEGKNHLDLARDYWRGSSKSYDESLARERRILARLKALEVEGDSNLP